MSKNKKHAPEVPPPPSPFWLPALLFLALPIYEMRCALAEHDFPHKATFVHDQVLSALSILCFVAAAGLAVSARVRDAVRDHLDSLGRRPARAHAIWLGAGFLALWAWLWFIRYCQYRSFGLAVDTTDSISMAHHFVHFGTLVRPAEGISNGLSEHFTLLEAVFSPLTLLSRSPVLLLLAENFLLVSGPIAVYGLVWTLTASSFAAFAGLLLALSSPVFYEVLTANFSLSFNWQGVLMLWAMLFALRRRWWSAGLLTLLLAGCTEEMPVVFFGLGLYSIHALGWRQWRSWLIGLGICAASLGLWFYEQDVMRHFSALEGTVGRGVLVRPEHFRLLVPEGTPTDRILIEIVSHPLRTFAGLFSSHYNFYPTLQLLFSSGLLPLLSPWQLLPFACADLPHLLATFQIRPESLLGGIPNDVGFQNFGLRYGAIVWGPLFWATAYGIQKAYLWLSSRKWEGWLLVWALLVAGFGFRVAHRTLSAASMVKAQWFDAVPALASRIPPDARVWTDEWASPVLANRPWIDSLTMYRQAQHGRLFRPDFVLYPREFSYYAPSPYKLQVLTFLAREGYVKVAEESDFLLLAHPKPDPHPTATPQWIELPAPQERVAAIYVRDVLTGGAQASSNGPGALAELPDAEAINAEAEKLSSQGRFDEIADAFRKLIRWDSKLFQARVNLGITLADQQKWKEAEEQFRTAIELSPNHPQSHFNLGECLRFQNRIDEATTEYAEAKRLDPKHFAALP